MDVQVPMGKRQFLGLCSVLCKRDHAIANDVMQQKGWIIRPKYARQAQIVFWKFMGAGDVAYHPRRGWWIAERGRNLISMTALTITEVTLVGLMKCNTQYLPVTLFSFLLRPGRNTKYCSQGVRLAYLQKPHVRIPPDFLYMLSVVIAQLSSDVNVIRYILPLLLFTSCYPIME